MQSVGVKFESAAQHRLVMRDMLAMVHVINMMRRLMFGRPTVLPSHIARSKVKSYAQKFNKDRIRHTVWLYMEKEGRFFSSNIIANTRRVHDDPSLLHPHLDSVTSYHLEALMDYCRRDSEFN